MSDAEINAFQQASATVLAENDSLTDELIAIVRDAIDQDLTTNQMVEILKAT